MGREYQQVLADGELEDDRSEERSKLRLTGLVVRRDGRLVSYNPIYGAVFNNAWLEGQLADLRPEFYSLAFREWDGAGDKYESFLLRGKALEEAEEWAKGKKLSDKDEQFLKESRSKDKDEIRYNLEKEKEARKLAEKARELAENEKEIVIKQQIIAEKEQKIQIEKIESYSLPTKRITLGSELKNVL